MKWTDQNWSIKIWLLLTLKTNQNTMWVLECHSMSLCIQNFNLGVHWFRGAFHKGRGGHVWTALCRDKVGYQHSSWNIYMTMTYEYLYLFHIHEKNNMENHVFIGKIRCRNALNPKKSKKKFYIRIQQSFCLISSLFPFQQPSFSKPHCCVCGCQGFLG